MKENRSWSEPYSKSPGARKGCKQTQGGRRGLGVGGGGGVKGVVGGCNKGLRSLWSGERPVWVGVLRQVDGVQP